MIFILIKTIYAGFTQKKIVDFFRIQKSDEFTVKRASPQGRNVFLLFITSINLVH